MNKQTRKSFEELAAMLELLAQCQSRVERIPKRFPQLYIHVPPQVTDGLHTACAGIEELARQLAAYQNLPFPWAEVFPFQKSGK